MASVVSSFDEAVGRWTYLPERWEMLEQAGIEAWAAPVSVSARVLQEKTE